MGIENGILAINHKGGLLLYISRSPRRTFSEKKSLLSSSLSWIAWSLMVLVGFMLNGFSSEDDHAEENVDGVTDIIQSDGTKFQSQKQGNRNK